VAVRCSWTVAVTNAPVRRHFERDVEFSIVDVTLQRRVNVVKLIFDLEQKFNLTQRGKKLKGRLIKSEIFCYKTLRTDPT